MIFDSHAHYDDEAFDTDRQELLSSMEGARIGKIVNVGASVEGVKATVKLTEQYPFLYGAVGIHPDHVGELDEDKMNWLLHLTGKKKIVAVGEIGLDYHWDVEPREVQKEWFVRQLSLAKEAKLPVIIHSRDAAKDTFDIIREHHAGTTGGVIHCYSGSREMARDYLDLGRRHFQERQSDEGSGKLRSLGEDPGGDGLPVPGSGSQPGKTQFLPEPALYHRGDCQPEGTFPGGSGTENL